MATHSSTLAWRIPQTEEPGGLYSPWDCKQSNMTERLSLTQGICLVVGLLGHMIVLLI